MSFSEFNAIVPYTIHQMRRDKNNGVITELWELDRSSYIDNLDAEEIKATITNEELLYSKDRTHITNWTSVYNEQGGWSRPAPHEGRCYCNNREDGGNSDYFVRIKFYDGVVSLSRVIFTYIHYEPRLEDVLGDVFDNEKRFPSNLVVKAKVGLETGSDPYPTLLNRIAYMYRASTFRDDFRRADPYNGPPEIFGQKGLMDMYQSIIFPQTDKVWIKHAVSELDFFAEGEYGAPFDISRIYVFGANTQLCAPPEDVPKLVKVWNTKQIIPEQAIGGPNKCIDDSFFEDPDNYLTYTYGPYTTLPEHYVYLSKSHANDFFTNVGISEVLDPDMDSLTVTGIGEINQPMKVGTYVIELDDYYDIYQINIEYSGSLKDVNGDTQILIRTFIDDQVIHRKEYWVQHEAHEGATIVHTRSRGVVSKWFPGFPWHTDGKTCLLKQCNKIEIHIVHVNGFIIDPILKNFLIRTRNTDLICDVIQDPIIPQVPSVLPNRNEANLILGDWAPGTNYIWDETKGTYTTNTFQTPAYGPNTTYPDYSGPETYAILDKKYSKYFHEFVEDNGPRLTDLTDGYLHVEDPFVGSSLLNSIHFSTPVEISFMRVYVLGPVVNAPWMQISISTADGLSYADKEMEQQAAMDFITGPGEHPTFQGGYFRTLPWDPEQQALFTNLSSMQIKTNQTIVGLQVWGHYLKEIQN